MKVRLLANGSKPWERWIRRWGLSFLVDDDILFDTFGNAGVLAKNIKQFEIDVLGIRHIVISHEHWDHIRGLRILQKDWQDVTVYVPGQALLKVKQEIAVHGGRVHEVRGPWTIREGVSSSGEIIGGYAGGVMPEQALVLRSRQGLVVLLGCAHPGVGRMVEEIIQSFGGPVYAVLGGFHLKDALGGKIDAEAKRLQGLGVRVVSPLHCSGARAERVFRDVFQDGYLSWREGQEIIFED